MPWRTPLAVLAVLAAFATAAKAQDISHVIRQGDTPVALAKLYHVPVADILARNKGLDPCRLLVGTIVLVPQGTQAVPPHADANPAVTVSPSVPAAPDVAAGRDVLPDEEGPGACYVVAPGDCPAGIATRFGVSLDALSQANPGLDPKNLAVGRVLAIPPVAAGAPPPVPVTRPDAPGQGAPLDMDFR